MMSVNLQNGQLQIYRIRVVRDLEVSVRDPLWSYQNVLRTLYILSIFKVRHA
jgi:hypothetical protein